MDKMKNNKNKIIIALSIIIIIVGIIMILTNGFNFDLKYKDAYKIELSLGKEFHNEDIKRIAKEQLNNQKVMIQKIEEFEDMVSITAQSIDEEQKNNIVTKVNEKYETEIDSQNVEIENVKHVRGRDLIKPYILPFAIATILILVYMAIRYCKLGAIKVLLKTVGILGLAEAVLFSIIVITRIPVGRLTIPLVIVVYIISLMAITKNFEKQLKEKKEKDSKEK